MSGLASAVPEGRYQVDCFGGLLRNKDLRCDRSFVLVDMVATATVDR